MRTVTAIVATTHPIEKYDGIALDEKVVREVAEALLRGDLPMHYNHDVSKPIRAVVVNAGTRRRDDGHVEAWVEFEVPDDEWDAVQAQFARAGAPGGMSISFSTPIREAADSEIEFAADAYYFTDADVDTAATEFGDLRVATALAYQFSAEPEAVTFVTIAVSVLTEMPAHVIAQMIFNAVRRLWKPERMNVLNLRLVAKPGSSIKARLRVASDDPETFRSAIDSACETLRAVAKGGDDDR